MMVCTVADWVAAGCTGCTGSTTTVLLARNKKFAKSPLFAFCVVPNAVLETPLVILLSTNAVTAALYREETSVKAIVDVPCNLYAF